MNKRLIIPICCFSIIASGVSVFEVARQINRTTQSKNINFTQDTDYSTICPVGSTNRGLFAIEDENNMMPPDMIFKTAGHVCLNSGLTFDINAGATYTIVLLVSDGAKLYSQNEVGPNSVKISYAYNVNGAPVADTNLEDSAPSNVAPKTLFSSSSNSTNLRLTNKYDMGMLMVSFTVPAVPNTSSYQGTIKVKTLDIIFNSNKTYGLVSGVQMYKGTIEEFRGYTSYDHDPCGLTADMKGPYADGSIINMTIPYKRTGQLTVDDFKSTLQSFDSGDFTNPDITVETDNYTNHIEEIDTDLDIVFAAKDLSNNKSLITYRINIIDTVSPIINQISSNMSFSYTTNITKEFLLSKFTILDNHTDNLAPQITGFDFTAPHVKVGDMTFTVTVEDESHNTTSFPSKITLIDDVAPTITGPDTITTNVGESISESTILSKFTTNDVIDGKLTPTLSENTYAGNENNIGSYSIIVKSEDKSGNITTKTAIVNVVDSVGPIFYINQTKITAYGAEIIDPKTLTLNLAKNGVIAKKNYYNAEFIAGDYPYTDNKVPNGTYKAILAAYADDNTTEFCEVTIEVLDKQVNSNLSFWDSFVQSLKTFFQSIVSFFTQN